MQNVQYAEKTEAVFVVDFKTVAEMGIVSFAFPDADIRQMEKLCAGIQLCKGDIAGFYGGGCQFFSRAGAGLLRSPRNNIA